jgi:hypothetical protein
MSKEVSPEGNVNVTIANVLKWFEESESCLFHNHAERIPITKTQSPDLVQSIIDSHFC